MGYWFQESIVSQSHLYHLKSIFFFKLLKCIRMVSLMTVLNANVWQFTLISIFSFLAHLIYLLIELDESFITSSVLIHLVCLITEPNGFICSDNLFLSVCSLTLGLFHYRTECDLCSDRQFLLFN